MGATWLPWISCAHTMFPSTSLGPPLLWMGSPTRTNQCPKATISIHGHPPRWIFQDRPPIPQNQWMTPWTIASHQLPNIKRHTTTPWIISNYGFGTSPTSLLALATNTGGRGGITRGVSFEFFESFFINLLTQYPLGKFRVFSKSLTTLIKTYSQGNFRNWSKKALHFSQWVILSKNPKVLS